jgi:membrane-bound serine protease (ClpP class)
MRAALVCMAAVFGGILTCMVWAADKPAPANVPAAVAGHKSPPAPPQQPVWIKVRGEIDAQRRMYLQRRIETAVARGADLLILEFDSAGSTVNDPEESAALADLLLAQQALFTVAYVPSEATGGAAIVALSCDHIVMGEIASLAGAPIRGADAALVRGRPDEAVEGAVEKVRAYAIARFRPPALAEAMVKPGLDVYHVRNKVTKQDTYMTAEELKNDARPDDWEKLQPQPIPETRGGQGPYLTVKGGARGLELKLAEATVRSPEQLQQRYQIMPRRVEILEENWIDSLVYYLHNPWIIGVLFFVGLVGMYLEITSPGVGAGAAVAILCFALYFWSHWAAGTAGVLEIVLFVLGMAFILFELFVTPGFGVPGILGVLMVVVSLVLASQRVTIPTGAEVGEYLLNLRNTLGTLVISVLLFLGVAFLLRGRLRGGGRLLSRLVLPPPEPDRPAAADLAASGETPSPVEATGPVVRVGQRGTAATPLRPAGRVRIGDEFLNVVAEQGNFIEAGRTVEVVELHGHVVVVREVR